MKRIKIAAIGAMLFLGLACNKNKNQIEPADNSASGYNTVKGSSGIKNEGNVQVPSVFNTNNNLRPAPSDPGTTKNPHIVTDPSTSDPYNRIKSGNIVEQPAKNTQKPIRPRIRVRNDEDLSPYQNAAKTATTIVLPPKTINDGDMNPNQNPK